MNVNQVMLFAQSQGVALLFKVGFLAILLLFALFLLIVIKQIRSMNTIVTQPELFPYLQTFVFILLGATVALFVATIVIL